jgi:hypothetical protein
MTIDTTATARFSDAELLEITSVAAPWIDTGLWTGLRRVTTPDFDRIAILPGHMMSKYLLQRDATGCTYLLYCTSDDLRVLQIGTLDECLRIFAPPTLQ